MKLAKIEVMIPMDDLGPLMEEPDMVINFHDGEQVVTIPVIRVTHFDGPYSGEEESNAYL